MESGNFENGQFDEILKLVGRSAPKMLKFSRWRDFNASWPSRVLLCDSWSGSAEE